MTKKYNWDELGILGPHEENIKPYTGGYDRDSASADTVFDTKTYSKDYLSNYNDMFKDTSTNSNFNSNGFGDFQRNFSTYGNNDNNSNSWFGNITNKVSSWFNNIPTWGKSSNNNMGSGFLSKYFDTPAPKWGESSNNDIGNSFSSKYFNNPISAWGNDNSNIGNGIIKNNYNLFNFGNSLDDSNRTKDIFGNDVLSPVNNITDFGENKTANASKMSGFYNTLDGTLNAVRTGVRASDHYLGDDKDGTFINWLNNTHNYLSDKTESYENQLKDVQTYSPEWFANQAIKGGTQVALTMIPGNVLSKGATALNWGSKAAKAVQMLPFAVSAGGNYSSDAERDNASIGQQLGYGIIGGLVEGASEAMFGLGPLINKFGKNYTKSLINSGANTLLGKYGKLGLSYAKNVLGEGLQEAMVDPAMGYAEKFTYNPNKALTGKGGIWDKSQMTQDFFSGVAMSALLAGLGMHSNSRSHKIASDMIENNIKPTPEIINNLQNAVDLDIKTIQAPQVNPSNAVITNGQAQRYPSVFNTNNLNVQNNNQSNNPYNISNIDTSKISYPVINTNPIIQPTLTKPTMTQAKNTPQISSQTTGATPSNINIENPIVETPKTIEAGQQYKLKNLGEVTIKDFDGKMITVEHKSGQDIKIGKDGFNKLNPQYLGSKNIEVAKEEVNLKDEIIDDTTPTEELDNPVTMYDNEVRQAEKENIQPQGEVKEVIQPTTHIEEKPSQKASKEDIMHNVNDEVSFINHKGIEDAGTIKKINSDSTYEIQRPEGDYILAKKNGDNFESIKSEPTPKYQIPLDERTSTNVGNRKIKAYQYLHPELKSFIQEDAESLLKDLKATSKGERGMREDYSTWGSQRVTSDDIAYLRDSYKMDYADIEKGLKALIEDNGSENIATSKKIELVIDHRLSHGYKDMMGNDIEANKNYISKKNEIEGKNVKLNTEVEEENKVTTSSKDKHILDTNSNKEDDDKVSNKEKTILKSISKDSSNVLDLGVKNQENSKPKKINDIFDNDEVKTLNDFTKKHKIDAEQQKEFKKLLIDNVGNIHSVYVNQQGTLFIFLHNSTEEYGGKKANEFILYPSKFKQKLGVTFSESRKVISIDKLNIDFKEEVKSDFGNIQTINGTKVLFNNNASRELYNLDLPDKIESDKDKELFKKAKELLIENSVPVNEINMPVFLNNYKKYVVTSIYQNKKGINNAVTPLDFYNQILKDQESNFYRGDFITEDYENPKNPLHRYINIIKQNKITRPISKDESELADKIYSNYVKTAKDIDVETELNLKSKFVSDITSLFKNGVEKYNKSIKKENLNVIEGNNKNSFTQPGEKSNQQQDKEDLQSKEKPQEQPKEETKQENLLSTISKFNDKFIKGEPLTLEEVKNHAEYVMNNDEAIKAELNKLTNKELDKMIGVWSSGRYSKKQDKVEHIYDNQLNRTYYNVADTDTLSGLSYGGKVSINEQMKDKIKVSLENLTQEKLDKILEKNKKSYNKAVEERKAKSEGIKNPTTLEEFETAKRYRKLTTEEQRQYEELKALDIKSKEKEKEVKAVTNLESNGDYEISKTQDTRDKRDLWVVKFKDKRGDFKSLNQQMKDLGGTGYSRFTRGFNFYFDPAEKLGTLKNGDTVKTSKDETKPNREKDVADKLRTVADNMQKTIDDKFADRLTNTARRANMAASAEAEGEALKKQQQIIRNIADLIESGQAVHLDGVSARTHIETLENILRRTRNEIVSKMINEKYPNNSVTYGVKKQYEEELKSNSEVEFNSIDTAEYPLTKTYDETLRQLVKETISIPGTARLRQKIDKAIVQNKVKGQEHYINTKNIAEDIIELYDKLKRSGKDFSRDYDLVDYKRLQTMGIKDTIMLRAALREFYKARGNFKLTPEETQAKKVKELERNIIGTKIESYFPTPNKIVSRMLDEANIQKGESILEPSAGSGHIADMIKKEYPENKLEVGEYNLTLSNLLKEKGHNVVSQDFLEHKGSYDKIIMNPPFEKNQDIIHVQHAYDLLKPGGRIVAITSEHPFFANDKKSVEFREWLEELGGVSEKLPEGSFKESDRSTGVSTRMVVIDKPLGTKKAKGTKAFMGANANAINSNGTSETLPRKQIIDNLIKEIDIPNRLGRISNRGALGIYKEKAEIIRTKAAEDIPILSHEIGHHLDKKYHLSKLIKNNSVFKKEILKLGEEQAKLQKLNTDGQIGEGIAEFVRLYLSNEEVSPYQFTAMFEKVIGKKFANSFNTFRTEYNKYLNASPGNRILSHVDFGDSRKSLKDTTKEKIEDFKENSFDKFYTTWVDELRPLYNLSKQGKGNNSLSNPYKMAWLFRGWSGKAIGAIKYGVYNYKGNKLVKVSKGLNEILKPIKNEDMDNFRKYIIAKRVVEKEGQGIRTGFDLTDANNTIAKYENNKDFVTAHEGLQIYQDAILRRLVDSGLMSEEQYAKIKELNKDYVPFYRALNTEEGTGKYTGDTFGNIKSPVKKMKGSNASIVDPIESIVKNTYYFTNLAERNLVAQSLIKFSEENEGMGKFIENVTPKMSVTKFELKEIKKSLEDANFDMEDADLEQFAAVFRPIIRGSASENIITVTVDGKPKLYQLDAEIYRAVMGLDKESSLLVFRIANMATKALRAGAILNPEFALRNMTRDALGAFIYSKYHFIPVIDTLKGLAHVFGKTETYNLWLNSGAAQSDFVSMDRDYLSKGVRNVLSKGKPRELLMDFLKEPLGPLRYLSSLSEEATRLGHFAKGLKKEGNSKEGLAELGLNTRDLTLDFSRSGTAGKNANKMVAFFNATIQGQDKMLRTFKDPKTRNQTLIKSLISVTLPSLILWAMFNDDEKIKELPLWRKNLFWNIPTENYVISIPKPFELGIIFGSLPERMLDYFKDSDSKAMRSWTESFLGNMLPGVVPTLIGPAFEWWANKSFFTGLPIENMTDKNAPAYQRYSASTSLLAKNLGESAQSIVKGGLSPKKIDNTIRGYTAGLGQYGLSAIDKVLGNNNEKPASDLRQIPGLKGFLTEPYSQARTMEDFYTSKGELKTKYDEAVKKFKSENPNIDDKEWTSMLKNDITPYKEKKVPKLSSELSKLHKQTYVYDKVGDYLNDVRYQEQAIYSDESLSAAVKQGKINELHFKTVQYLKELNKNINDSSINSLMNQFKPKKK